MTDVIQKLWGFCNTLRDEGMNYGQYIEQLTYLLFLKMAEERDLPIPKKYNWKSIKEKTGMELLEHYQECLKNLGKEKGILSEIFAGSLSQFREPLNLKKLINMIDETRWSAIDVDVKGAAYEGLLQKYASEQKGAGQYFTPRPLIRAIVQCVKPKVGQTVHDPALGTGGFLLGALEYLMKQTKDGSDLSREQNEFLLKKTFSGNELVLETKRLAMMNIYLHGIEADVYYGDSISEGPHVGKKHKVIITNPPFGIKSGGVSAVRSDFNVTTSNKQLNFVQHVMSALDNNGKAAMVVPDNVLFDSGAGTKLRQILLEDFNLHTILRLPIGTFTPYSPGVKANVIFFDKPGPTNQVWIYDLRTNIDKITKKDILSEKHFEEFTEGYDKRKESERWKKFSLKDIKDRKFNLDISWIKDKDSDSGIYEEPEVILESIKESKEKIIEEIENMTNLLINNCARCGDKKEGLANGWEIRKLSDVTDIIMGQSPPSKAYNSQKVGLPFFQGKAEFGELYPIPRKWCDKPKKIAEKNDVLMSVRAPVGPVNLANTKCCIGRGLCAIRAKLSVTHHKYIYEFLKLQEGVLAQKGQGSTFSAISKKDVYDIRIPIPYPNNQKKSLEVQQKIVLKLDSIFRLYNGQIKREQRNIDFQLEQFPKSVLSKAFKGDLIS